MGTGREPQEETGLVIAVVRAVSHAARHGQVTTVDLNNQLDRLAVPAPLYRQVVEAIASQGLVVVDAEELEDDSHPERPDNLDGLGHFLDRARHRVLTMEEEQALGVRIEPGRLARDFLDAHSSELDPTSRLDLEKRVEDGHMAEDELARHNIRLVVSVATKLRGHCTPALDVEDLIQEGYLGLARAISKWEHLRLLKFSTYATWWIRQSMQRAIADKAATIRLPVHVEDSLRQLRSAERELITNGRGPTVRSIAEIMACSETRVRRLLQWRQRVTSLDRVVTSGNTALGSFVAKSDEGGAVPEQAALLTSMRETIADVLGELSSRERDVIERRFGLTNGGEVETLEEIGRVYGVTRERIRQIEAKALKKLRAAPRRDRLKELISTEAPA